MAAPAQLPRADRTVLVLQDEDVSWLQALLPKSAAKRLQPALVGALEDQLLEDAAVTSAIEAGAAGYLLKDVAPDVIVGATSSKSFTLRPVLLSTACVAEIGPTPMILGSRPVWA